MTPFPKPDRCPKCKRGTVLESTPGWYCSRRYAKRNPCDWEKGDAGPQVTTRRRAGKAEREEFAGLTRDHMIGVAQGQRAVLVFQGKQVRELQARLVAIAAIVTLADNRGEHGHGAMFLTKAEARAVYVLARGTPARDCARLVKKWLPKGGKEGTR